MTQVTVGREQHTCIIRLLERPNADISAISAVSRGLSQRSAMRSKRPDAPTSKKDRNFYRKVSKYDIDRLQVDWKELMRERDRQNKVNQEIQLEEQEAESKAKVMDGFLSK